MEGYGIWPLAVRTDKKLAENAIRVLVTEILGVSACGKQQQGVQTAGEIAIQALSVVFKVVFGKIIAYRGELVFGQQ